MEGKTELSEIKGLLQAINQKLDLLLEERETEELMKQATSRAKRGETCPSKR
jgi:hypothetical protein